MATKPKVFISYSTKDHSTAEALYTDLQKAGADVFEFERTATPGSSAWDEVLGWIEASDVFIMLVSKSALKSRPVKAEVEHAHYRFLNSTPTRPSILIPAMLETDVQPPRLLERFTGLALYNYAAGVKQLIAELGLEVAPRSVAAAPGKKVVSPKPVSKDSVTSGEQQRPASSSKKPTPISQRPRYIGPLMSDLLSAQSPQAQPSAYSQRLGTPRPGTANVSYTSHVGRYLAVIGIVTLIGAIVGFLVRSFLPEIASGPLAPVTGLIRSWSESLSWLPLISALVIFIVMAVNAWVTTGNGIPVDSYDYAINSAKSLIVSLLVASIWIVLFSQTVSQTVLTIFVLACVLTTMGTVAAYAVFDEWS